MNTNNPTTSGMIIYKTEDECARRPPIPDVTDNKWRPFLIPQIFRTFAVENSHV